MLRFLWHVLVTCAIAGFIGYLTWNGDLIPLLLVSAISLASVGLISLIFYPLLGHITRRSSFYSFDSPSRIERALKGEQSGNYPRFRAMLRPYVLLLRFVRDAALGTSLATTFNAIFMWLSCQC